MQYMHYDRVSPAERVARAQAAFAKEAADREAAKKQAKLDRLNWARYLWARRTLFRIVIRCHDNVLRAGIDRDVWKNSRGRVARAKANAQRLRTLTLDPTLAIEPRRRACVALAGLAILEPSLAAHLRREYLSATDQTMRTLLAKTRPDLLHRLPTLADARGFEPIARFVRDVVESIPFLDPVSDFGWAWSDASEVKEPSAPPSFRAETLLVYRRSLETGGGTVREGGRVDVEWLGGEVRRAGTLSREQLEEFRALATAGTLSFAPDSGNADDEGEIDRLRKRAVRFVERSQECGVSVTHDSAKREVRLDGKLRVGEIRGADDVVAEAKRIAREIPGDRIKGTA